MTIEKKGEHKIINGIITIGVTFIVFIILKNIIGNIGGMPQAFKDAYKESFFIRNRIFNPAIITLMSAILIHLMLNYIYLQKNIQISSRLKGSLYGFSFGVLWFFGFLELVFTYNSDFSRHVFSGIRDLLSLTVFGVMVGMFFSTKEQITERKKESILVILPTSLMFAVFHGLQYCFAFKSIEQNIDIYVIFWLVFTGVWIGLMYYLFSPSIENIIVKTIFFAFNTFGVNWLLYNSFYNLFLDIPVVNLIVRCSFGVIGIWIGLLIYELARKRHCKTISSI